MPRARAVLAFGFWPITRPTLVERARRIRPTAQLARRMRVLAATRRIPTSFGTTQRFTGAGVGSSAEAVAGAVEAAAVEAAAVAAAAVVAELAEAEVVEAAEDRR